MSQLVVGAETQLCAITLNTCVALARSVEASVPLVRGASVSSGVDQPRLFSPPAVRCADPRTRSPSCFHRVQQPPASRGGAGVSPSVLPAAGRVQRPRHACARAAQGTQPRRQCVTLSTGACVPALVLLPCPSRARAATRRSRSNVARCIAGVCESMSADKRRAVVNQMLKDVKARDKFVRLQPVVVQASCGRLTRTLVLESS